jgi:SulP family sulfate permease
MALNTPTNTTSAAQGVALSHARGWRKVRPFAFLDWLIHYRRADLSGDLMAGLIVAIMLVPQGMAYALLAGLPPQVGLYASIVPLIIYGLLGSSRTLAVGPVAIVSLMVATGVGGLAEQGTAAYLQLVLTLALMVGVFQLIMGVVGLGFLVNFLSHPVLSGFTSAAAIVIGFSQVKHVLGYSIPRTDNFFHSLLLTAQGLGQINFAVLAVSLSGVGLLLFFKNNLGSLLQRMGVPAGWRVPVTKAGPLVIVLVGTLLVWAFDLNQRAGVTIVGEVPPGLPGLTLPLFDLSVWQLLLPTALTISFVGYMESISVAQSLASKRRQRINANQELVALGAANLGATFTGGYPVTGGFSRSIVNFTAGANTGLASIITAVLVGLTVIFLTPLFYYLPNAMLAAIILVAVANLIDLKTPKHVWRYNKTDFISLAVTFVAVLSVGIEAGIVVGVAVALGLYLWRTSRPHVAVVGRVGETEHFRNVLRHQVNTLPQVIAIRVDESLYFANTRYLEETLLGAVASRPEVEHVLLICSAVNFIDASALESLEDLNTRLGDAGVTLHLAEVKGPVMDRLRRIGFVEHLGEGRIFLSTHHAFDTLAALSTTAEEETEHVPST